MISKKRTIGRSFRIYKEWNEVLEEEANREGISVNALMNKILQEYSIFRRHAKNFGTITLSYKSFATILEGCSGEWIKSVSEDFGSTVIKDLMLMMGLPLDQDNLIFVITNFGEIGGLFKIIYNRENGKEMLHLNHNLGRKWSVYLAGAISGMFKSVLNKEVKTEIFDNCVTIEFNT